jgi:hypothetical protein
VIAIPRPALPATVACLLLAAPAFADEAVRVDGDAAPPAAEAASAEPTTSEPPPAALSSPPVPVFEAGAVRAFADHLLEDGDAYRAIGEYRRYLFLSPGSGDADLVTYRIALAYLVGEQHTSAIAWGERVENDPEARPEVRWAAWAAVGRAFFDLGQHGSAAIHLAHPPRDFDDSATAGWADYVRGWSRLQRHELEEAAAAFAAVPAGTEWHGPGLALAEELSSPPRLSRRSPVLAGLLSIVPGLGHLYLGMWGTALSALTWNGAFAWGLYETARTEQWGLFALLAVLESVWYTGTIYGAVAGAFRHNRDARQNWLESVAARHPAPGAPPQPTLPGAAPLDLDGLGRF